MKGEKIYGSIVLAFVSRILCLSSSPDTCLTFMEYVFKFVQRIKISLCVFENLQPNYFFFTIFSLSLFKTMKTYKTFLKVREEETLKTSNSIFSEDFLSKYVILKFLSSKYFFFLA